MRPYRYLGWGLIALAGGLVVASVLGPLVTGVIHYRVSGMMLSQLKGADAVSLALVAPLSAAVALLAFRGHRAAPALALGPAAYALYMFAEMIVGPDYLRLPGNNERFFPLLLGVFILAGAILAGAWNLIDPARLPPMTARRARAAGALLVALGGFLVLGRYLPGLAGAMRAKPTAAGYLAGPSIFWTIALEDLGIVIPAMIAVGIGMWRGSRWAARASFAVAGWAALVPVAVAGMSAAMYLGHQPSASLPAVGMLAVMAVVFLVPAALCYPPLFRRAPAGQTAPRGAGHARPSTRAA